MRRVLRQRRTPIRRRRGSARTYSSHGNTLTARNLLDRHVTLIRWGFLVLSHILCTCIFASHPVLPYLGLVGSFICADAVGFYLAGVEGRRAVTCIAQREVI